MPYSFLSHLECSRTGERLDADAVQGLSPSGAPLLARYDLDGVREAVTPKEIAGREPTLWRYHEVLPVALGRAGREPGRGHDAVAAPAALRP